MTIKELVKELKKFPDDTLVMCSGYEGGFDDVISKPQIHDMLLNVNDEWYYGSHEKEDKDDGEEYNNKYKKSKAVIL